MDNDDFAPQPQGFTRYVEKSDFDTFTSKVDTTFHGEDGRNGIVADIQILKTEWKTAKGLLSWIAGGSLLTFVVSVVTLAKAMGWF